MALKDEQIEVLNEVLESLENVSFNKNVDHVKEDREDFDSDSGGYIKNYYHIRTIGVYICVISYTDSYSHTSITGVKIVKPKVITITEFE